VYKRDTTGPQISCLPSSAGRGSQRGVADCQGEKIFLPDVQLIDNCSESNLVKAIIPGYGTLVYTYFPIEDLYKYPDPIELEPQDGPMQVVLEAFDNCHNNSNIVCDISVGDETMPVAIAHKGLTLELSDKKVWLPALDFDNGSYDNCDVNLVLARRTDWLQYCVTLCDSLLPFSTNEDGDTIWCIQLEDNSANEVESHFYETLQTLKEQKGVCSQLVYNSWIYDLCRYASVDCKGSVAKEVFEESFAAEEVRQFARLGGGWSARVPFGCEDVCQHISVELLIMDYWCNWSKSWTDVLVEDKSPVQPVSELTNEVNISCTSYREDSIYFLAGDVILLPLAEIVERAEGGDPEALESLNGVLGGYNMAWRDDYGQYVDLAGNPINAIIDFDELGICICTSSIQPLTYYDDQTQQWVTSDSMITSCDHTENDIEITNGVLEANCSDNTFSIQSVTTNIDKCGSGTIERTFKIWKECPVSLESPDTLVRYQVIHIGDTCRLRSDMFELPRDIEITSCELEYDPNLSGNVVGAAHPDSIGQPKYLQSGDCRIIGLAHQDKVFSLGPGVGGYRIVRTWYFADWCEQQQASESWWDKPEYVADIFVQTIILRDTVRPACYVEVDQQVNDTIHINECSKDLTVRLVMLDNCILSKYDWVWQSLPSGTLVGTGGSNTDSIEHDTAQISLIGAEPGLYRLGVRVMDHAANESYCSDTFVVRTTQAPLVVCLPSTDIQLSGFDTGGDPSPDTAVATIFAESLVMSTTPACNDTGFIYRVEDLDDFGDDTYADDLDSLILGCGHLGDTMVRVWAISMPSGNSGFCDVAIAVSDPENLCPPPSRQERDINDLVQKGLILHQNRPNPVMSSTTIAFELDEETAGRLTIFDLRGEVLFQRDLHCRKGYQEITIDRDQLPMPGLLYYQMETDKYSATRKMILR
ncbi:MAG: T9SS type A sorting domain-containing protein, partial [Saprospiraceae bacterium]|nr:T9SS type A sorting domain-containing protein [Saprospiraceae bacterium]